MSAPDLEQYSDVNPIDEYWVVFYTEGVGQELYIKYFNCDYFAQEQAMERIAPGIAVIFE